MLQIYYFNFFLTGHQQGFITQLNDYAQNLFAPYIFTNNCYMKRY